MTKAKVTLSNMYYYCQGWLRNFLFFNKYLNWLLPLHIFEQINYRLFVMDKQCLEEGHCVICGCATPALQMCDKACDKPCYPEMQDETEWYIYKLNNGIEFKYWKKGSREFELRITHKTVIR